MLDDWFRAPWTCGHNDPIYRGLFCQECAICGERRYEPGHEPEPVSTSAPEEVSA